MSFDRFTQQGHEESPAAVNRLKRYHKRRYSLLIWIMAFGLCAFVAWASVFRIDQVARARGEVIASRRVQIIQAVDGGVLAGLYVKEGDRVENGQILAELDQARFGASVKEIEARLSALKAKATRLRAEVTGVETLIFSEGVMIFQEQVAVERALFLQRRSGLKAELETLEKAVVLAKEELALVMELAKSGDVNRSEVIRAERGVNEARSKVIVRKNRFLEGATTELTKVEDAIGQNEQVVTQRRQQLKDSVLKASVPGIVKNIRVTTVGGVLRAGEELMQIIPVGDTLIVEAKVSPADIALVHPGLETMLRFDPYDYTIYGGVKGRVTYVSADTLKERTARGDEIYYRVHVATGAAPVSTTIGKTLEILPGMTAQLDIRTGDRSVMEYLLKPLRKTLTNALGER